MIRLLSFLSVYRNAILFLFLEVVAFVLIIRFNDHQRHKMGDTLLNLTSSMYHIMEDISHYFSLDDDNASLMDENIKLRRKLLEAKNEINQIQALMQKDSLDIIREDTLKLSDEYTFLPGRVIKNSTSKNYNYLVLDIGSEDGVEMDMGVVSPDGVVGRIIRVSEQYSLALSALNVDFKLILKTLDPEGTEEEGNVGFYEWRGKDPRHAYLTYIPETVKLDTGYVVVTSGNSQIFPPGYLVGTISWLGEKQDGFYDAQMELAARFNSLSNVYLISSKNKAILDSLEQGLR